MVRPTSPTAVPANLTLFNKPLTIDRNFSTPPLQNATGKINTMSFDEVLKLKEQKIDMAKVEESKNTKAHTILRQNRNIIAIQWSDGGTDIRGNSIKSSPSFFNGNDSPEMRVRKMVEYLKGNVTVERYDGRADAPTRSMLEKMR